MNKKNYAKVILCLLLTMAMVGSSITTVFAAGSNGDVASEPVIKTFGDYTYWEETYKEDTFAVVASYEGSSTSITLPSTINGLKVKTISSDFSSKASLKSITISENIVLDKQRFRESVQERLNRITSLEEVKVVDANQYYTAVDGVLYNKDITELLCYPKSKKGDEYAVPNSVEDIYFYDGTNMTGALYDTLYLQELAFPDNKELNMLYSTCHNSSISKVTISSSIKWISDDAFLGCKNLKDIVMGANVTEIGDDAFSGCTSLEEIDFSDKTQIIGHHAFENCTALTNVVFPDSMLYVNRAAFEGSPKVVISKPSYLVKRADGTYVARAVIKSKTTGKKKNYLARKVSKIKGASKSVVIKKNKAKKLNTLAYVGKKKKPSGYLVNEILSYTPADSKICTVSRNGKLKALKKGTTTVKVAMRTTGKGYNVKVKVY